MDKITVRTDDGYTFTNQPDGSFGDGDMAWDSFDDFKKSIAEANTDMNDEPLIGYIIINDSRIV